jgi:hypothetical protein
LFWCQMNQLYRRVLKKILSFYKFYTIKVRKVELIKESSRYSILSNI